MEGDDSFPKNDRQIFRKAVFSLTLRLLKPQLKPWSDRIPLWGGGVYLSGCDLTVPLFLFCCHPDSNVSLTRVGGASCCCSQAELTCSMAGVREGVGSDGLQLFMGEKSEAVTSRVGGLICRTLGGLRVFPEL